MFKKAMIAGAVALASVGSYAATADLAVRGVINPEPCAITLGNGGTVDYGTLSSAAVKLYGTQGSGTSTVYTAAAKTISLDVTCSAPTAVSLSATDNRASSRVLFSDANDVYRFGLGVSNSTNIGNYTLYFNQLLVKPTATSTAAAPAGYLTRAKGSTGAWAAPTGLGALLFNPANTVGFKQAASDTAPPALSNISGNLQLIAAFSKSLVDSATTAITLDGSTTLSVDYI